MRSAAKPQADDFFGWCRVIEQLKAASDRLTNLLTELHTSLGLKAGELHAQSWVTPHPYRRLARRCPRVRAGGRGPSTPSLTGPRLPGMQLLQRSASR